MKVLIACEESQRVCIAFRERGHEAYSCDIQDCSGGHPEWHIKGDALEAIRGGTITTCDGVCHDIGKWDLLIAHPPCTYLSNAGACRLYPHKGQLDMERYRNALLNVQQMLELDVYNPILFDYVEVGNCDGCAWKGLRHQRCSCCRRNRFLKDGYTNKEEG